MRGCPGLTLASPRDPQQRGSQLSFRHPHAYALSQALIARQERAPYTLSPPASGLSPDLDDLQGHVVALAKSGALAERTQQAVATNRAKRGKDPKAA